MYWCFFCYSSFFFRLWSSQNDFSFGTKENSCITLESRFLVSFNTIIILVNVLFFSYLSTLFYFGGAIFYKCNKERRRKKKEKKYVWIRSFIFIFYICLRYTSYTGRVETQDNLDTLLAMLWLLVWHNRHNIYYVLYEAKESSFYILLKRFIWESFRRNLVQKISESELIIR